MMCSNKWNCLHLSLYRLILSEQIIFAFRQRIICDLQRVMHSLIKLPSFHFFLSFYIYNESNDPCKNTVPATTLPGCPFTLCNVCKMSFIPLFSAPRPALPPSPPTLFIQMSQSRRDKIMNYITTTSV